MRYPDPDLESPTNICILEAGCFYLSMMKGKLAMPALTSHKRYGVFHSVHVAKLFTVFC